MLVQEGDDLAPGAGLAGAEGGGAGAHGDVVPPSPKGLLPLTLGDPAALYRKVMIWPRVQGEPVPNLVSLTPEVMPFSTAHSTAS